MRRNEDEDITCTCLSSPNDFQKYLNIFSISKYLRNVKKCTISNCTFELLNFECIDELSNLTHLLITSAKLSCIEGKSFINQRHLVELSLESNDISKLPSDVFEGLISLEVLNLGGNNLVKLDNIFSPLNQLKQLLLDFNKISSIATNAFHGLDNLKELNLERNELQSVGNSLQTLHKISLLNLNYNMLEVIEKDTFENLHCLKELFLEDNKIIQIHPDAFANLKGLIKLDLSYKPIKTWSPNDESIINTNHRTTPKLDVTKINDRPDFSNLNNLKNLNLGDNNLVIIESDTFKGLFNLLYLNLHCNNIIEIACDAFQHQKTLFSLDLFKNCIEKIDDQLFEKMTSLHRLDLSYNKIKEVNGKMFKGLVNLKRLDLGGNNIECIDIDGFPESLQFLDLSYNNLITLKPCNFYKLKNLETLLLNGNSLDFDNDSSGWWFDGLNKLEVLELGLNNNYNRLSKFSQLPLPMLKRLYIKVAGSSIISPDFFEFYSSIRMVKYDITIDSDKNLVMSWRKTFKNIFFSEIGEHNVNDIDKYF